MDGRPQPGVVLAGLVAEHQGRVIEAHGDVVDGDVDQRGEERTGVDVEGDERQDDEPVEVRFDGAGGEVHQDRS